MLAFPLTLTPFHHRRRRRPLQLQLPLPKMSQPNLYPRRKSRHLLRRRLEGRRRRFQHTLQLFRSNKSFFRNNEKSRPDEKLRKKLPKKSD